MVEVDEMAFFGWEGKGGGGEEVRGGEGRGLGGWV